MSRAITTMVLILALNLISDSRSAVAFTVRFGAIPASETPVLDNALADSAVPTPQMLQVTIGADGVTFGPIQTALEPAPTVPVVRMRRRAPAGAADEPAAPRARSLTTPRQLRGAEIMLWRDVKQVAKR